PSSPKHPARDRRPVPVRDRQMLASIFMRSRAGIGWAGTRRRSGTPGLVVAVFVAIAAGHVLGTVAVLQLNHVTSSGEPFFPAAGITLAALVLLPRIDFVAAI